jgi:SAM-dependent methyltransferase
MDPHLQANLDHWNDLVPIHARSRFYDVEGFRAGQSTLDAVEVAEVGDVHGKSLLHLQCHFGMSTLSWARMGAAVTGADFSEPAITLARSLAKELRLPARFVCSDVYALPEVLPEQFDIVFTSYGVLCWLPDLTRWGQVIAQMLKPGGLFCIVEFHPMMQTLDDAEGITESRPKYPYFHQAEPLRWNDDGTYADLAAHVEHAVTYEWSHSLADIVNALIRAGLRIECLHEFPYCCYAHLPRFMERGPDGWWWLKQHKDSVPLMFSIRAIRDERGV